MIATMTTTLRIEHAILDFDTWKRAFEGDPLGRAESGVLRHRICRPLDDSKYLLLELDFATTPEAERFLERLQQEVWSRPDVSPALARPQGAGPARAKPVTLILQEVEARAY